jgi:TolA-binding protein
MMKGYRSTANRVLAVLMLVSLMAVSGCSWLEPEPESYQQYLDAKRLFDGEDYAQAAVAYRAWLADYHDQQDVARPFVLYQLGECYRLMRDYERATTAYTRLVELHAETNEQSVKDLLNLARLRLDDIRPKAGRTPEPAPAEKSTDSN